MKSVKFAFAALVLAGGIVAAFAFTAPAKKVVPDTWFRFDGDPTLQLDIKNPLKYTRIFTTPTVVTPDTYLQAIKVELATEVYPASHATYPNKPIVNVTNALQADILNATGISDGTLNEITDRVVLKP